MDINNNPWWLMFSLLFICLSLNSHVSNGADTISANQSLSGDQTIVSARGVFVLGFVKPGNSSNYYIGMWYNLEKVPERTIVWVANREKPISDRYSSVLRISEGNLVLFDESKTLIWSTNVSSTTSNSVEAVLQDDGNIVLRERSSNLTDHLWQSFDHPGHTWFPGMKIGYNKKTQVNQLLTSWKNKEDPAPGLFSLELDPANGSNQYIILWNKSERYWTSGAWDGKIFSWVPEMTLNYIYNFSYVNNENESYFIYTVKDFTISRFIMDLNGQVKQMNWLDGPKSWFLFWSQPREKCEVYAYCGASGRCHEDTSPFCDCMNGFKPKLENDWNLEDYAGGCERKTQLQCGNNSLANGKSDRFLKSPNMHLPVHPQSAAVGSIEECETTCFNNCSCSAYAYDNNECSIWIGELLNLQQLAQGKTDGKTIYIKLAASEFSISKDNKGIIIGRRNSEPSEDGTVKFFPTWAANRIAENGDLRNLLDPRLEGNADVEELSRICKLACWCIQDNETHRPSMGQVVQILEGVVDVTQPPIPRSLQLFEDNQEHILFFTESSSSQSSQTRTNTSAASSQIKSTTSSRILFMCFSLKFHVSSVAADSDTLSVNQSLSGDQTIVSARGVFVLGFFKPGNSSNSYLGMWYNLENVSEQTVVWVANRDKPISDIYSSVLRITNGNLVLFDESQKPIWSTDLNSTTTSSIEAVLLDEGNLVLRDRSDNLTDPFWQSFDHPGDTWLPGMKIGFNKRTNVNHLLMSWKNKEDPAPGRFTLELDPTDGSNQYFLLWNRSKRYWASGAWNGHIFSSVPEMRFNNFYNYSFISDKNGRYFIYDISPTFLEKEPQFTSRFIIDDSGQIKQLSLLYSDKAWFQFWSAPRPCQVYAYCGAFGSCGEQTQSFCGCVPGFKPNSEHNWNLLHDHSGGCVRETQLQCENNSLANGESDRFLANADISLPEHPKSVAVRNITECKTICLTDCSCTAYAYEDNACSIWNQNLMNLQQLTKGDPNGKTIYIKLAASEFSSPKKNKETVISVAVGSAALVLLLGLVVIVRNCEQSEDGELNFFPTWALNRIAEGGDILSLLDHRLEGNADVEELSRMIKVACWCIQDDENHRPSMGQVVQMLEGIVDVTQPPVPRCLRIFVDNQKHRIFFTDSSSSQSTQTQKNTSTASSQIKSTTSSTSS
ncbi:hypothetical protein EZV62_020541 [Acer yangbiense]|uniref:Non-specific serine/threonine protein kinase n=1 Tax=Acer yangbiense TaxID=1000413 RepID=A0A5C7HF62_9ROSI|nr:hypothetical protein EZV62_020541 [Acer yangbiense]